MADAGLAAGPAAPQTNPDPDTWMRIVGDLPLMHQPGERWLYQTSASVLGVLAARVGGRPLPELLAQRLLNPISMRHSGFTVLLEALGRLGPHWAPGEAGADSTVYDEAAGQMAAPPAFCAAADGLVSTVDDIAACRQLRVGRQSRGATGGRTR